MNAQSGRRCSDSEGVDVVAAADAVDGVVVVVDGAQSLRCGAAVRDGYCDRGGPLCPSSVAVI